MAKNLKAKSEGFLEHQRRIWDTISFRSTRPLLLTGVGVFTPVGTNAWTIYVDARPITDNLRPLDVETKLESKYGDFEKSTITIFSKVHYTAT